MPHPPPLILGPVDEVEDALMVLPLFPSKDGVAIKGEGVGKKGVAVGAILEGVPLRAEVEGEGEPVPTPLTAPAPPALAVTENVCGIEAVNDEMAVRVEEGKAERLAVMVAYSVKVVPPLCVIVEIVEEVKDFSPLNVAVIEGESVGAWPDGDTLGEFSEEVEGEGNVDFDMLGEGEEECVPPSPLPPPPLKERVGPGEVESEDEGVAVAEKKGEGVKSTDGEEGPEE